MMKRSFAFLLVALPVSFTEAALVGSWQFDNPENLLEAKIGADAVVGAGNPSVVQTGMGAVSAVAKAVASDVGAVAIPQGSHLRLKHGIPTDSPRPYSIVMKVFSPSGDVWRNLLQWNTANTNEKSLFINTSNFVGGGLFYEVRGHYQHAFSSGDWHTVAVVVDAGTQEVWLDGSRVCVRTDALAGSWFDFSTTPESGAGARDEILISADDTGDDKPLYFSFIEIYDEALPFDALRRPMPVGLWEFNADDPTRATYGIDLVEAGNRTANQTTVAGDGVFETIPGLSALDGAQRVGHKSHYWLYHDLPTDTTHAYTLVMDIRSPTTSAGQWRSLLQPRPGNTTDAFLFINKSNEIGSGAKISIDGYYNANFKNEIWYRLVLVCDLDKRSLWLNGNELKTYTHPLSESVYSLKGVDRLLLFGDESGDDYPMDVSTVMLFDYALSPSEVKAFHALPIGTIGNGLPADLPRGEWLMSDGIIDGRIPALIGEDLLIAGNGNVSVSGDDGISIPTEAWLTWDRTAFDGSELMLNNHTYVFDITKPASNTSWMALYQSDPKNATDGTFFTNGDNFGWLRGGENARSFDPFPHGEPMRVVIAAALGNRYDVYVNGVLYERDKRFVPPANSATFSPQSLLHFFADNNGEHKGAICTYLAAYDRTLSPLEIALLGGPRGEPAEPMPEALRLTITPPHYITSKMLTFDIEHGASPALVTIDFGDGESAIAEDFTESSTRFTHAYAEPGTYTIHARLRNPEGFVTDWIPMQTIRVYNTGVIVSFY